MDGRVEILRTASDRVVLLTEDIHFVLSSLRGRRRFQVQGRWFVWSRGSVQQLQELWLESPSIAENEAKFVRACCVFCPFENEIVQKLLLSNSEYC